MNTFKIFNTRHVYTLLLSFFSLSAMAQVPSIKYNKVDYWVAPNQSVAHIGSITNNGGAVAKMATTKYSGADTKLGDYKDGKGDVALFKNPKGIAIALDGVIYIADTDNHRIRKIDTNGTVSTFAGSGEEGNQDGQGVNADFNGPTSIAIDNSGNLYVADCLNNIIRKITPDGTVKTIAGNGVYSFKNADAGQALDARFKRPQGIAVGTDGSIYIADTENHMIRKVATDGRVTTLAGSAIAAYHDDTNPDLAQFKNPQDVAVDAEGNVYIADTGNNRIRKISTSGSVSTLVGDGLTATLNAPCNIAISNGGILYVTTSDHKVFQLSAPYNNMVFIAGSTDASTLSLTTNYAEGVGANAKFSSPRDLAVAQDGAVYVAGNNSFVIHKIDNYFLSPKQLPAGLLFNSVTGIIYGTATTTFAKTEYKISAGNLSGVSDEYVFTLRGVESPAISAKQNERQITINFSTQVEEVASISIKGTNLENVQLASDKLSAIATLPLGFTSGLYSLVVNFDWCLASVDINIVVPKLTSLIQTEQNLEINFSSPIQSVSSIAYGDSALSYNAITTSSSYIKAYLPIPVSSGKAQVNIDTNWGVFTATLEVVTPEILKIEKTHNTIVITFDKPLFNISSVKYGQIELTDINLSNSERVLRVTIPNDTRSDVDILSVQTDWFLVRKEVIWINLATDTTEPNKQHTGEIGNVAYSTTMDIAYKHILSSSNTPLEFFDELVDAMNPLSFPTDKIWNVRVFDKNGRQLALIPNYGIDDTHYWYPSISGKAGDKLLIGTFYYVIENESGMVEHKGYISTLE